MYAPSFHNPYKVVKVLFKYYGYKRTGNIIECYFLANKKFRISKWTDGSKKLLFGFVNVAIFDSAKFEVRDSNFKLIQSYGVNNFRCNDYMVDDGLLFEGLVGDNEEEDTHLFFKLNFNCEHLDLDNDFLLFTYFITHSYFENDPTEFIPIVDANNFNKKSWWKFLPIFKYYVRKILNETNGQFINSKHYKKIVYYFKLLLLDDDDILPSEFDINKFKEPILAALDNLIEDSKCDKDQESWRNLYDRKLIFRFINLYDWILHIIRYPESVIKCNLSLDECTWKVNFKDNIVYVPIYNRSFIYDNNKNIIRYKNLDDIYNKAIDYVNNNFYELCSSPYLGFDYCLISRFISDEKPGSWYETLDEYLNKAIILYNPIDKKGEFIGHPDFFSDCIYWNDSYGFIYRNEDRINIYKQMIKDKVSNEPQYAIPILKLVNKYFDILPFVNGYNEIIF